MTGVPSPTAPAAASSTEVGAAPIPYRSAPAVTPGDATYVMLVTVLLLGAVLGGLLLARRRGWLRGTLAPRPSKDAAAVHVCASTRLSAATRLHVVESGGARFVVVESTQHVAIHGLGRSEGGAHAE